jgi:hypothetical protein
MWPAIMRNDLRGHPCCKLRHCLDCKFMSMNTDLLLCWMLYRPKRWINCSAHMPAAELPQDATINTNGAGDAFTSGLVVAAMLRHTGMALPAEKRSGRDYDTGLKTLTLAGGNDIGGQRAPSTTKKITPYSLYMKENYVSLKRQCKDDKRAIFTRCHEMWENESENVKTMYERMAREEHEELGSNTSTISFNDIDSSIDQNNISNDTFNGIEASGSQNRNATNASLSLEAAVQFAGEIAAYHIDMSTRSLDYVDINRLLEKAMCFSTGPQEI